MLKFAFKSMLVKRGRMALVALSIIISATVALMSLNVSQQINDGILSSFIYYDMIIGPSGSSTQLAMNTMFFTDKPLGTIPYSLVEELEQSGLVNRAVPFSMGDSFNSAKIVGTTPALLEDKPLSQGAMFEEVFEAVVGSEVASRYGLKPGDQIVTSHGLSQHGAEHASSPLTVTGILKTTHTNYDNTVFTSYKTVWAVHSHEEEHEDHEDEAHEEAHDEAHEHEDEAHGEEETAQTSVQSGEIMSHGVKALGAQGASQQQEEEDEGAEAHEGEVCAILIKSTSLAAYSKLSAAYSQDSRLLVINPATVLRDVLSQVDTASQIVYILCGIILVMNILVISVLTLLNLMDSKKDIALMRMIGISMKRIRQLYLIQNGMLGLIAIVLSLVLSHLMLSFIGGLTAARGIVLSVWKVYPLEIAVSALVFVLSVLPTMISIYSMSKKDVIE